MEGMPWYVNLIIAWLPFIALVIFYVLLAGWIRKYWGRSPSGAASIELTEQKVAEIRRMNATLERIALTLEKRGQG